MNDTARYLRPLLTTLVVLLLIGALRLTQSVTMPLGLAVFFIVLAWPLQRRLERRLPRWVSFIITVLAILLVLGMFVGAAMLCVNSVAAKGPEYQERFGHLFEQYNAWAEHRNFPVQPRRLDPNQTSERAMQVIGGIVKGVSSFLGAFALMLALLVLGLLEVRALRDKLEKRINTPLTRQFVKAGEEVTSKLQVFMLARTFISAVTGVLVGLYAWAIGLDFPLVWGLSSFLLNYIPIIGSTIAVIPPTLLALIQPGPVWLAPATLAGMTAIQFTLGNYVEPRFEGRVLKFSPFVLFTSIMFWGWVWSIPGALLGVPITLSIAIVCRHFDRTRWLHELLTK
jgi:AI-2 transport protein TqsA